MQAIIQATWSHLQLAVGASKPEMMGQPLAQQVPAAAAAQAAPQLRQPVAAAMLAAASQDRQAATVAALAAAAAQVQAA